MTELIQMNQRVCFVPELVKNLSEIEKKRAMRCLVILTQKRGPPPPDSHSAKLATTGL